MEVLPKRDGIQDPRPDEDDPIPAGGRRLYAPNIYGIKDIRMDEIESAYGSISSGWDFRILRSLCLVMPRTSDAFVRLFL